MAVMSAVLTVERLVDTLVDPKAALTVEQKVYMSVVRLVVTKVALKAGCLEYLLVVMLVARMVD